MRSPDGKVIPNRSATSLWLRAERWYVVWGLFGARTKQNTLYSIICASRVRPDSYPTLRQPAHPLHPARQARVPNHPALPGCLVVPPVGVEPTRPCGHLILSQARLPISPRGILIGISVLYTMRQLFAISLACEMIIVVSGLCAALQRRTISASSSLV